MREEFLLIINFTINIIYLGNLQNKLKIICLVNYTILVVVNT